MPESADTWSDRGRRVLDLARAGDRHAAQELLSAAPPPATAQERAWRELADAALARAAGEVGAALTAVERAVTLMPAGPDLAEATRELAVTRLMAGDAAGAEVALDRAAALYEAAGLDREVTACRANQALVLRARGRYTAALGMLDAVRGRLRSSGDQRELARLDLNRAALLTEVGRCEAALQAAQAAEQAFSALGESLEVARARWAAAAAAEGLRLYREALAGYRSAIELLEELGAVAEAAQVKVNLAEVYRRLGDPQLALQTLDEAAAPLAAGAPAHRATLLLNRAAVLAGGGRSAAALAALDEAAEIFRRLDLRLEGAEAELWRARLQMAGGDFAAARTTLQGARLALATSGLPHEAAAADLLRAELAWREGRLDEAAETCWSVLGVVPEALSDLRWRAWWGLLRATAAAGDARQALEYGLLAADALEQLGAGLRHDLLRAAFDEAPDHGALYAALLQLCHTLHDAETALAVMQRAKARSLVDAVSLAELPSADADASWLQRERDLAARLHELLTDDAPRAGAAAYQTWVADLAAARQELLDLHLGLAVAAPEEAALRGLAPTALDAAALRRLLPRDALLLETFTEGDDLTLLALGQEVLQLVHLPGRLPQVREALARYESNLVLLCQAGTERLAQVGPGLVTGAEADLAELYDLLLAPLADIVDSVERLVIAPHGPLWGIPWAALHDGLDLLVETHALGLVPSAAVLARLATRPAASVGGGLAVGGAREHLAAVEAELRAVSGVLDTVLLRGAAATREAVLAASQQVGLVHFCGHAVFRPESPLFSALRLENGELITAADLYRCRLPGSLVTLAACETGRQGTATAELVGLARAFLHAGARQVIASLWWAPDAATGHLMASFYEHWRATRDPAAALAAAQREVRRSTLHPFFWAGFAVIGWPWAAPGS
ncbi:MAG: CHAT domain-containing protein [Fimbriimonadaceae bacterium]|nr:CHAT domain-containing protein [Fimbriimonadaceae bacterium]